MMKKIIAKIVDIAFYMLCGIIILFLMQLFCYTSFQIPSDSMKPALKDGDRILVNKMIKGARLFDVLAALDNQEVTIFRMPGWGNLKRNDVLVFNFPYQENHWDSIRMDVMLYYVKRCIGLPGDILEIRNGFYRVQGCNDKLGNIQAQESISVLTDFHKAGIRECAYPFDNQLGWSVKEFGPLLIPKKGQITMMNRVNYLLYRQLVSWEQKKQVRWKNDQVLLGDSVIYRYYFEKNYYFVSGDNMPNSQDSRCWGMLPEEYIVGKAVRVWNSIDKHTGKIRWERIMKKIE